MSTIQSSDEHLTLNASGSAKEIKLQANGVEKAKITSTGIDVTGAVGAKGSLTAHQTNAGIMQYSTNQTAFRSYGATAGSGWMTFQVGGGGGSTDSEAMRIDSSGNVGIGTTSPSKPLDVNGAIRSRINGFNIADGTTTAGALTMHKDITGSGTNVDTCLFAETGNQLHFMVNGSATPVMTIETDGEVKVGNLITTTSLNTNDGLSCIGNGYSSLRVKRGSDNGDCVAFYGWASSSTPVGSIFVTNSSTSYNTTSDYRLKENVVPMSDGIDRLKQLKPSRFNFISDATTTVDGFLAHEAQTVIPEAVTGTKDEVLAYGNITDIDGNILKEDVPEPVEVKEGQTWTKVEDKPEYQSIDQAKLVPLLTSALQEAVAKIEALEARVTQLENK